MMLNTTRFAGQLYVAPECYEALDPKWIREFRQVGGSDPFQSQIRHELPPEVTLNLGAGEKAYIWIQGVREETYMQNLGSEITHYEPAKVVLKPLPRLHAWSRRKYEAVSMPAQSIPNFLEKAITQAKNLVAERARQKQEYEELIGQVV